MERTEKRKYERPATRIVEMQQSKAMLQSSPGAKATRGGYGAAIYETWD